MGGGARTALSVSHVSERHTIRDRVLCMFILIVHTHTDTTCFLPPLKRSSVPNPKCYIPNSLLFQLRLVISLL